MYTKAKMVWKRSPFTDQIRSYIKNHCILGIQCFVTQSGLCTQISGPSCSKLRMSLVNDSLKFTSSDMQICWNFLLKKCAIHIFSAKVIRILYIEYAKTVNEMTLNELIKLTTLWTTRPWYITPNIGSDRWENTASAAVKCCIWSRSALFVICLASF